MKRWLIAVKPMALPKILLPVIAGLSLGYREMGDMEWQPVLLLLLLAVCAQWLIVLLNDYADREADRKHAIDYPELLDRRVLTTGLLTENNVLIAALLAVLGMLAAGAGLYALERPYALYLGGAGLVLLAAYSFPPLKLNYRGGGEILETMGTGILLPLLGYYISAGHLVSGNAHLLLPVTLYGFVGALISGLKHEPADRDNGKNTLVVLLGPVMVRRFVWAAQMAVRVWCGVFFLSGEYGIYAVSLAALLTVLPMYMTRRYDSRADYRDLVALGAYKKSLLAAGYLTYVGLALDFALG
ncbi:MAG: UbiA family prenyltransferase [Candidatus Latescibacterota bacterium]